MIVAFVGLGVGRRAPHGARGLKSIFHGGPIVSTMSRPARGAWIEISKTATLCSIVIVAPRTGRVD